ncbi:MAG: right-handed parallel beta-helix repeat-containing protein [Chitinophagales bacterium]|nr:right-handed parallel beta-helix repeat-containing protein [Chitinophagales bacterium]
MKRIFQALAFVFPVILHAQIPEVTLSKGMLLEQSCTIRPGIYELAVADKETCITISGNNLVVDFKQAELRGAPINGLPNLFTGTAIVVKGKNITLRNLKARGYKVALYAEGVDSLLLEDCDFSYNYRPRLRSIREREDFSDWLSYHHNEKDEWLRYGAGIYLKNCQVPVVRGCRITGCQNALLMSGCNKGVVYNNFFTFNSGLGIGLYRSSGNTVKHNRLDWNVRGYSHGFYQRGQDSAGILLYEQSSNNTIAYNSATHCGDGLFLWAGQYTMDTGEGGCNDNWIFGNDFSYAPTNGIEVTFSRNRIQGNVLKECTYGIWGGYSYDSYIMGNFIADCKTGIAIEHGQNDTLLQNLLQTDSTGIHLWGRESQPADWGYAKKRDTRSRDAVIDRNVFLYTRKPLKISRSKNVSINGVNLFTGFETLLETPQPNENLKFLRNEVYGTENQLKALWAQPELKGSENVNFSHPNQKPENPYAPLDITYGELHEPDSLPDGMVAALPRGFPKGRRFILMGEWGPADFQRPVATLDTVAGNMYSIVILGPSGSWNITKMEGVKNISARRGTTPKAITVERDPAAESVYLEFEYNGQQGIKTVFGEPIPPGSKYVFYFDRFEKQFDWKLEFFRYDSLAQDKTFAGAPLHTRQQKELYGAWWGSPAPGVPEDGFATRATTEFEISPGEYTLELSSDDGVRMYLDDQLLINNWDVHEPETDELNIRLGGKHKIRVEHFDAGGFATLDFRVRKTRNNK